MTRLAWGLALAVLGGGCAEGGLGLGPARPVVSGVQVDPNPFDALSLSVSFQATGADSARVLYTAGAGAERSTPWSPVGTGGARLVVLGLATATRYGVRVEAAGPGGVAEAGPVAATTGAAPAAVRNLTLEVTGTPSPGYTLLVPIRFTSDTDNGFLLAFDSAGALCWYREFDGLGWAVEAKQLESGDFSVYLGRSYGWAPSYGRYAEVTPEGVEVQDFRVDQPWFTDPHEMLLSGGGSAPGAVHLIGYGFRTLDLSAYGGPAAAELAMHFIERQGPTGAVEFLWSAADHYTPDDWPSPTAQAPLAMDLVHPSSLAIDRDGGYILSLQAMDEIAKIDAHTGAFVWRLGGRHNQFRFEQDPLGGFQGQHNVQVLDDGHLLLLDNRVRSEPAPARAVEYALDTGAMTATLVWAYQPSPAVISPIMGSVQRLVNGHTVVGFGYAGRVDEVDAAGAPVAQALLQDAGGTSVQFFRALRVASLYRYQRP